MDWISPSKVTLVMVLRLEYQSTALADAQFFIRPEPVMARRPSEYSVADIAPLVTPISQERPEKMTSALPDQFSPTVTSARNEASSMKSLTAMDSSLSQAKNASFPMLMTVASKVMRSRKGCP